MAAADAPREDSFLLGDVAAAIDMEARPEDAPDVDEDVKEEHDPEIPAPGGSSAAVAALAAAAPPAAPAAPKPSVWKVAYLKDKFTAAYVWHEYLGARSTGSKPIMAKRLDKLRGLVQQIQAQYEDLAQLDRVELWKELMAGAEAAIAEGTNDQYDLDFASF